MYYSLFYAPKWRVLNRLYHEAARPRSFQPDWCISRELNDADKPVWPETSILWPASDNLLSASGLVYPEGTEKTLFLVILGVFVVS